MSTTKIFLVDDHPIIRQTVTRLIERQDDMTVCGEADSIQAALEGIPLSQPDLVLIDVSLPNGSGIHLVEMITTRWPELKALVVSGFEKAAFAEGALAAGARGYVVKGNMLTLLEGIRSVMAGNIYRDEEHEVD